MENNFLWRIVISRTGHGLNVPMWITTERRDPSVAIAKAEKIMLARTEDADYSWSNPQLESLEFHGFITGQEVQ